MVEEQIRAQREPMPYAAGALVPPAMPRRMTKKRYLELSQIANELVNWLRGRGVLSYEGCTIQSLANTMWEMPDEEPSDAKPNPSE